MTITPQRSLPDHVLAVITVVTSSYAIAMSVNKLELAVLMAVSAALSCLAGFGLSQLLRKSKIINYDGWLFALSAFVAVGMTRNVNAMLPEEGFPFQLIAAVMMWLIMVAGGIFAWRDGTILFLSLPGIALFGLVGVIDVGFTGLLLFCIFLISVAVLYARSHQRAMLAIAEKSGADTKLLWRDSWRWVAGPEWAFAAAGVIIVLSFIGAPLVQISLSGVSGAVGDNVTQSFNRAIRGQRSPAGQQADQRIGQGPIALDDTVVLEIMQDRPRYLRNQVFTRYTGSGWNKSRSTWEPTLPLTIGDRRRMDDEFISEVMKFEGTEEQTVRLRGAGRNVATYAPGIVIESPELGNLLRKDGVITYGMGGRQPNEVELKVIVGYNDAIPDPDTDKTERDYYNTSRTHPEVSKFAAGAVSADMTDFEKAEAIRDAITKQVRYNLRAPATPPNRDPVDYFLFDSKEGYCDVFASAMTLGARSIGLPARYVTGYIINSPKAGDGFYPVRNRDYHAWSEVYFDEYGWVPFDATEGAEEVEGGGVGTSVSGWEKFLATLDWAVLSRVAMAVLVAVAGLFWWVALRRPDQGIIKGGRGDLVRLQYKFQKDIERIVKHPCRFSQTLNEYLESHRVSLGALYPESLALSARFSQGVYGPDEVSSDDIRTLRSDIQAFVAKLNSQSKQKTAANRT